MGKVLERINYEVRTIGGVPWQPWTNPYWRFNIGGPVHPSQQVNGVEQALGLAAVYSCVRFIADAVASLPINVYRKRADGTSELMERSQLLDNPSADLNTTLYDWIFMCIASALLWGNAWGLISSRTGVTAPGGLGYPQTIEWLPPDRMWVQDDEQQPWNPLKATIYLDGRVLPRDQLVHVRAFVIPGKLEAISPLRAFQLLHQQGVDALKYSADWFHNGGFPPGTFQNLAEEVDSESAREIRQRLTDTLRMRQPLVYGKDWDYKPVVVPPNEAAFVEAMQLNATQIAAIYGVPPTKVGGRRGDSLTYATQEQETLSLITDTLRPWLVRMEHLFTSLLPTTQFARFNTDALLKTDLKTRSDIYRTQREIGMVTINEIRRKEDMPPLDGEIGDDKIPLDTLSKMSGTTRAIPNSMLPEVTLEAELVAEMLQKLEQEYVSQPEGLVGGQLFPNPAGPAGGGESGGPGPGTPQPGSKAGGLKPEPGSLDSGSQANGTFQIGKGVVKGPGVYLGGQMTLGREYVDRVRQELRNGNPDRAMAMMREVQLAQAGRGDVAQTPFGPGHQLAMSKDRARACVWIDAAFAQGCLEQEERDDRYYKASNARTRGVLAELIKDLPSEAELVTQPAEGDDGPPELPLIFGPKALALLQGRNPALLNGSH